MSVQTTAVNGACALLTILLPTLAGEVRAQEFRLPDSPNAKELVVGGTGTRIGEAEINGGLKWGSSDYCVRGLEKVRTCWFCLEL
jgi:hypothetical protein